MSQAWSCPCPAQLLPHCSWNPEKSCSFKPHEELSWPSLCAHSALTGAGYSQTAAAEVLKINKQKPNACTVVVVLLLPLVCNVHVAGEPAQALSRHLMWVPTHVSHLRGNCPNCCACQLFLVKMKGAFSTLPFSALPLVQPRIQDTRSWRKEGKITSWTQLFLWAPPCLQRLLSCGACCPGAGGEPMSHNRASAFASVF